MHIHSKCTLLKFALSLMSIAAYHPFKSNQSANWPVSHFRWIYLLNICRRHYRPSVNYRAAKLLVYRELQYPVPNYRRPQCIMNRCPIPCPWPPHHHRQHRRHHNHNTNINCSKYRRSHSHHRNPINRPSIRRRVWSHPYPLHDRQRITPARRQ